MYNISLWHVHVPIIVGMSSALQLMPEPCYISSVHHLNLMMMRVEEAVVDASVYFIPYLPPYEMCTQ